MTACWNEIGVRGNRSCGELTALVHCRNCAVYASAAHALLDCDAAPADVASATEHLASPTAAEEQDARSLVIFRVGDEWLALPTTVVKEVAELRPVHSLPHRRGGAVLGVANLRGELLVCLALARLLRLERTGNGRAPHTALARLLVLRRGDVRAVCHADEVYGVHRAPAHALRDIPATVAHASSRHTSAMLTWQKRSVGVLDDEVLFQTIRRSLA
jgi:chemotaxis-related protein WspD